MIAPELDVRRHEAGDRYNRSAKHDVLARSLEVVVHNLVRTRAAVSDDSLGILADSMILGDIAVDYGGVAAVESNSRLAVAQD